MNDNELSNRKIYPVEYAAWLNAIARCYNDNHRKWPSYGGRGITVCDSWLNSFDAFITDMGAKCDPHLSLDRIDNNKGYFPDNCRWATITQQNRNRRKPTSGFPLTINGQTKALRQWAQEYGLDPQTITYRQKKGLSGEALIAPSRNWRQRGRSSQTDA